jgi:hypothetical protein
MLSSAAFQLIAGLLVSLSAFGRFAEATPSFNLVEANKHLWASAASKNAVDVTLMSHCERSM